MIEGIAEVSGSGGLFAENASRFVSLTGQYAGSIRFVKEDAVSNAKSILSVLSLELNQGERIKIRVDGPNEQEALQQIVQYLKTMP